MLEVLAKKEYFRRGVVGSGACGSGGVGAPLPPMLVPVPVPVAAVVAAADAAAAIDLSLRASVPSTVYNLNHNPLNPAPQTFQAPLSREALNR